MADKTLTDITNFVTKMLLKECASPDSTAIQYLANEAVKEISKAVGGFYQSWTGLTATNGIVTLPNALVRLESVFWDGRKLDRKQTQILDALYGDWRSATADSPSDFVSTGRTIILYPAPTGTTAVKLVLYGYGSLSEFPGANPLASIPEIHQMGICDYILANYPADMNNASESARVMKYSDRWTRTLVDIAESIKAIKNEPFTF